MNTQLWHWPVEPWLVQRDGQVRVRLLVSGPMPDALWLRAEPNNEEWLTTMVAVGEGALRWYEAVLPQNPASNLNRYCFKALYGEQQLWLGSTGVQRWLPPRDRQFSLLIGDSVPEWLAGQVIYQIFPDRFARGDGPVAAINHYIHNKGQWAELRDWQQPLRPEAASYEFYGGNLWGINQRLDYLQKLGVTCLYLTPIFTAPSPHRYDVADYFSVDHRLGGNAALIALRQATAARGMRLLLDGVFNHSGDEHPWFNRHATAPTSGAWQRADSPFRNFYCFRDGWPGYHCWGGRPQMPALNYAEPRLRELIYAGDHSALRHWLKPPFAIDGWRLDSANQLGSAGTARDNLELLRGFRQAVRAANPQAVLIGEHWNDASSWLQGDAEDGCMNYHGFNLPLLAFFAGRDQAGQPAALDGGALLEWLAEARSQWPAQVRLAQFNLLGGADLPRIASRMAAPLLPLAQLLQFTLPGVPAIYYGDELGMSGGGDPANRAPMPWSLADQPPASFALHQQLIALRQQLAPLHCGEWWPLSASGRALAFARLYRQQLVVVALNADLDHECELMVDLAPVVSAGHWHCRFTTGRLDGSTLTMAAGRLILRLPAASGGLWQLEGASATSPLNQWSD